MGGRLVWSFGRVGHNLVHGRVATVGAYRMAVLRHGRAGKWHVSRHGRVEAWPCPCIAESVHGRVDA